ncbi:MAG: hypothetical protein ACT4OU_05655 [Hyphomicrobium sp.]
MPDFADTVRVRETTETQGLGLAGLTGSVRGFTTPSVTGIAMIGDPADDYAIAVHIDDRDEDYWFHRDLLELVDHGPGSVITVDGVNKRFIRNADGSWSEEYFDNPRKGPKQWWRFW